MLISTDKTTKIKAATFNDYVSERFRGACRTFPLIANAWQEADRADVPVAEHLREAVVRAYEDIQRMAQVFPHLADACAGFEDDFLGTYCEASGMFD